MATTTDMHRTWRLDLRGKPEAVFVVVCPVVWAAPTLEPAKGEDPTT